MLIGVPNGADRVQLSQATPRPTAAQTAIFSAKGRIPRAIIGNWFQVADRGFPDRVFVGFDEDVFEPAAVRRGTDGWAGRRSSARLRFKASIRLMTF
jgi:hypothetical protein